MNRNRYGRRAATAGTVFAIIFGSLMLLVVLGMFWLQARHMSQHGVTSPEQLEAEYNAREIARAAAASQSTTAPAAAGDKVRVVGSIPPVAYFVTRIGGERVSVETLVSPGQSPHAYEPTPRQMMAMGESAALFRIGIQFEDTLVTKAGKTFPKLRIVDLRDGIALRSMAEGACTGDHEGEHDHDHDHAAGAADPHSWLNPRFAKMQARSICAVLGEIAPAHADEFRQNLAALETDLDRVDREIAEQLARHKGASFFVYHPAFGYFADRYGLTQVPVEIDGKEPSAKQLGELIERARAAGVKVIFVQPQFSSRAAESVAKAIGGTVVPMDDLAADYIENLKRISAAIQRGLTAPANGATP